MSNDITASAQSPEELPILISDRKLRAGLKNKPLNTLEAPAEVFYRRLFSVIPASLRFPSDPSVIRDKLYPIRDVTDEDILRWVDSCVSSGLILIAEFDGKKCLQLNGTGAKKKAKPTPSVFEGFWTRWPAHERKVNKKACLAHWTLHKLDNEIFDILEGLKKWKASETWTKEGGSFIPAPLVWIGQRRWEAFPKAKEVAEKTAMWTHAELRELGWSEEKIKNLEAI